MADRTVTDLPLITSIAGDDFIHVVDVSDTTGSSEGTSKKTTISDIEGVASNLSYTASPTDGVINNDNGTGFTIPAGDAVNASLMLPADKTKIDGIAAGATVNSTDAFLLARANHTGTQLLATISDSGALAALDTVDTAEIDNDAVTLDKMAGGTDGNLISYDINGDPVAVAPGDLGQVLTSGGAGAEPTMQTPTAQIESITATVGSSALTVGLQPTVLAFRNATLTDGAPTTVTIGSALSLVVPSGATLGTVNAIQSRQILVAINNSGTGELAIVNIAGGSNLDETTLISTTTIGTGSDANNIFYSTTGRSNVPFRVVGFVDSTQAAAGTWDTSPTVIQGVGGNALTAMSSIGYGQTWQDVSGSRSTSTTFFNTTGKPLSMAVHNTASPAGILTIGGIALNRASNNFWYTGIVPPGNSYVFSGSFSDWVELR